MVSNLCDAKAKKGKQKRYNEFIGFHVRSNIGLGRLEIEEGRWGGEGGGSGLG